LGVDRVMYGEIDPAIETITVERSWGRTGVALLAGRFHIGDFGRFFSEPLREGLAVYSEDAMNDPQITPEEYEHSWARVGVRAEEAYLVMREAVRNAVAHSGCGRVDVSLEIDDTELKGHVRDDGTGFDQREPPDGGRDGREDGGYVAGVGLRSMRERTGQLGGQLEVHSEPGLGTTVEVRVPLVG
jgi:anti-sigma regulatory factor (Ser/Thr protein kinase)